MTYSPLKIDDGFRTPRNETGWVTLYCEYHPQKRWTAKDRSPGRISNNPQLMFNGEYRGGNFVQGPVFNTNDVSWDKYGYAVECNCPMSSLIELDTKERRF